MSAVVKDWQRISSQSVVDLGLFRVSRDRALSPRTEKERDFFVVHMPDWLQIVPVTGDGRLVLVRQYRHASRLTGLELPGGLLDPYDAGPAEAAARELKEETGYGGGRVTPLGSLWPQPAMLANRVHFFAAVPVEPMGPQQLDEGEDVEVVLILPRELDDMIADGRIHNAMTVAALAMARSAGVL
jgi:ADP-ribose pyrophosphatase